MVWRKKKTKFVNEDYWVDNNTSGNVFLIDETGSDEKSRQGFWLSSNVDDSLYSGKRFDTKKQAMAEAKKLMREN